MVKRRLGIIAFLLCFCLAIAPYYAQAASTADAKEPISPDQTCFLSVSYSCDGSIFSNLPVALYKIAEISADFQYTLSPAFQDSGLVLNGIQSNSEWNVVRSTLEAYILANDVPAHLTNTTDVDGCARFRSLKPGLYLIPAQRVVQEETICAFDSALVALPGLGTDGLWQYAVNATAKGEMIPTSQADEDIQLKVLKLWKGDEHRNDRPQSVEVEIFRDGVLQEAVTLSEENHWSYSWTTKNDGANWVIVERNIPTGYIMTVEERTTSFVVTNTFFSEDPPGPPLTGDTTNILLCILLMNISGIMLIILGKRMRA